MVKKKRTVTSKPKEETPVNPENDWFHLEIDMPGPKLWHVMQTALRCPGSIVFNVSKIDAKQVHRPLEEFPRKRA